MEEWRDIKNFPGYQVSSEGRVKSHNKVTASARFPVRHWKDRILRQKIHRKDHYARVDLWRNGKVYTILVHRLVAEAFVPTDNTGLTVNHKDGNKANNTTENLEWMTLQDNIKHEFETGLATSQKQCVLQSENGETYTFRSQSEASRFVGRNNSYVNNCISRKRKHIISKTGERFALI